MGQGDEYVAPDGEKYVYGIWQGKRLSSKTFGILLISQSTGEFFRLIQGVGYTVLEKIPPEFVIPC